MKMQDRMVDTVTVLEMEGRFDAYEAPGLRTWLDKKLANGASKVVVDLAGVNFVDSTALATLVQGMKRTRDKEGDLHLCNMQQPVRIIFELTRLDRAFKIYSTPDEAMRAFNGS